MWFFSAETNEVWEVCCGREVEGTFLRIHGFFPASRQRQSRAASMRVTMYTQRSSHCYFLWKCHLVTQIESFSVAFSSGGSANNHKEPRRESRVPVEPQECCVWPRKFESASARILRTLSARPNYRAKWNVPNQCLSPPPLQVLGRWHDGLRLVNELVISASWGPTRTSVDLHWHPAIFESVVPLLNLCDAHAIVTKNPLKLQNGFHLAIAKLLAKFDATPLLESFHHFGRK